MRATLTRDVEGGWVATALPDQDSSLVKVLALADALIVRAPWAPAAASGDVCRVIRLDALGI
jgi:molybdopterin molybdotransferase